jgi:hypothetical protein
VIDSNLVSTQTVAHVVNVGQDWFTFRLPESRFTTVWWLGRTRIPKQLDDALDYGLPRMSVYANLWVATPAEMSFKYWGFPEGWKGRR